MSKKRAICEYCGALMLKYKRRLDDKATFGALLKIVSFKDKDILYKDAKFKNVEYSVVNFLRCWGLIEESSNKISRHHVPKLTSKGKLFVNNEISLPSIVITYRKKVDSFEGENLFFKDIVAERCKQKEEYLEDAIIAGE